MPHPLTSEIYNSSFTERSEKGLSRARTSWRSVPKAKRDALKDVVPLHILTSTDIIWGLAITS